VQLLLYLVVLQCKAKLIKHIQIGKKNFKKEADEENSFFVGAVMFIRWIT
jgi:hypothetical protein